MFLFYECMLLIGWREGSYLKISINKKKIQIIGLIAILIISIFIINNAYLRAKTEYEQQVNLEGSDKAKYQQKKEIEELINNYIDEYVYKVWVVPEYRNKEISNLYAVVVYDNEVPEKIKTSLVKAISDEFSIDRNMIDLEYMDYDEIFNP